MHETLPDLVIGKLKINPPFILGGMGVRVTEHKLCAAAANTGMAGTIASVGLGHNAVKGRNYVQGSNNALAKEIKLARKLTKGVIGVNIMVALTNYAEMCTTAAKEKADYIISGAGLPMKLPEYVGESDIALIPIVSSGRAAKILCNKWLTSYNRLPDAFVVEGVDAGGHLGFNMAEVEAWNEDSHVRVCKEVLQVAKDYEEISGKHIPVIAAGGIFDGNDIGKMLAIGCEGVQMATRFVTTEECQAPDNFKQAIINSTIDDMVIIKSPVGMLGRAIKSPFTERVNAGETIPFKCPFHCISVCKPKEVPFCIAVALLNAVDGDIDNGVMMAGHNAYRVKEILPIKKLVDELTSEAVAYLNRAK
jgi:nitronate monooxygenase